MMQAMEVIDLNKDFGRAVLRAAGVLRSGGVIVYPTDTLYGLGADAFSDAAAAKVYAIKARDPLKPIHCVVADMEMAAHYAELNDAARRIAEKFLPGPLTLILRKKPGLSDGIARGIDTMGIRIPKNEFCLELAKSFGKPYTATSANIAGMTSERSLEKISTQLGERGAGIDLWVDAGELPESAPSTIVNLVSGFPSIIREGAIPAPNILSA